MTEKTKLEKSIDNIRFLYHKNPVLGDQICANYFFHDLETIIEAAEANSKQKITRGTPVSKLLYWYRDCTPERIFTELSRDYPDGIKIVNDIKGMNLEESKAPEVVTVDDYNEMIGKRFGDLKCGSDKRSDGRWLSEKFPNGVIVKGEK